jgi:hypothetical protein
MLGRADTGDAVKGLAGAELEKVCHFDAALARQSSGANARARKFRLFRAERESHSMHAVVRRGVQDQRAPAATHVEQALSRFET